MDTFIKVTFSIKNRVTPCACDEKPGVQFPAGAGNFFSICHPIQSDFGLLPTSYSTSKQKALQ
jgi:hypothetical protein